MRLTLSSYLLLQSTESNKRDFGRCADAGGEDGFTKADVDVEILITFLV